MKNLFRILGAIFCLMSTAGVYAQCTSADYYGHLTFFGDGSDGNTNYEVNQSCDWSFESGIGGIVRVGFYEFNTEENYDFVRIYDGVDANAPLIAELSGNIETEEYLTTQPFVYITWSSDNIVTAPGFSGYIDSFNAERTSCEGTISDGVNDYPDNATFRWTIEPPDVEQVTLSITSIDMESCCDFVRVYDGTNNSSPLIGTYTGGTPVGNIVASSGTMFVEMTTDGSITGAGFEASYYCSYCSSITTVLTASSGTISDGSGANDYANRTGCGWLLQPQGAEAIQINFTSMDLESCCDFVRIYDGPNDAAPQLGIYTGSFIPGTITTPSGTAFVTFSSDIQVVAGGFSLDYADINTLGMDDIENDFSVNAYPNPTAGLITLDLAYDGDVLLTLQLFDIQGRQMELTRNRVQVSGSAQHILDLSTYETGSYILQLSDEDGNTGHLKILKTN